MRCIFKITQARINFPFHFHVLRFGFPVCLLLCYIRMAALRDHQPPSTFFFFFKRKGITLASQLTFPLSIKNRSAGLRGLSKPLQDNNSCCDFVTGENFTHCSAMTPVKSMMLHRCRKKFVPVILKCPTHVSVRAGG